LRKRKLSPCERPGHAAFVAGLLLFLPLLLLLLLTATKTAEFLSRLEWVRRKNKTRRVFFSSLGLIPRTARERMLMVRRATAMLCLAASASAFLGVPALQPALRVRGGSSPGAALLRCGVQIEKDVDGVGAALCGYVQEAAAVAIKERGHFGTRVRAGHSKRVASACGPLTSSLWACPASTGNPRRINLENALTDGPLQGGVGECCACTIEYTRSQHAALSADCMSHG